jgi:dienelactone hydrolase
MSGRLEPSSALSAGGAAAAGARGSVIGAYGAWAAALLPRAPGPLSLQHCPADEFAARRSAARDRVLACMAPPPRPAPPVVTEHRRWVHDGLEWAELSWPQPAGAPTRALVLKPAGMTGRLPGVLALHDHGGFKFFGKEKSVRPGGRLHPLVARHQAEFYGDRAWANEVARQGHVVLVHDAFAFGSRRVRRSDVPAGLPGGGFDEADDSVAGVEAYNAWAAEHEHVMAKSLFSAGTTWPGVFFNEDRTALDVLCARDEVDAARIGAGGLSGGGLRTVFLAGLDERVTCAVCVGMMTTWRDFVLNRSHAHTWMCQVPHLPRELDYPEILGLRAPRATLVLNTREDALFTPGEMRRAEQILRRVYASAGAPERFQCSWHPGGHQFGLAMQAEAAEWFARWLR